jgi:formylglycine-generating enzyme required for sulfatase activity
MKRSYSNLFRYGLIAGVGILAFTAEVVLAQTPGQISIARDGSQLTLSWDCVAGRSYQVLSTSDLTAPWEEVATEPQPLVAGGNRLSQTVSVGPETRFYRVAELAEVDYMVIELSGGPTALSYPVSYMDSMPPGGWTDEYKTTKLVMRRIPAGTFMMGAAPNELGGRDNETQREVTLTKDFYIGVFPVTQRQWEKVMGNWPSYFSNQAYRDSRPVERVSYHDIREDPDNSAISPNWPQSSQVHGDSFMGKLRARTGLTTLDLPTEAQWEYACRAGTTTALNSGKNLTGTGSCPNVSEVGRYRHNHPGGYSDNQDVSTDGGTAKVGSYLPNEWGLYDMHGNVWEWCLDWYESYHAPTMDPVGAASWVWRVFRGGGWYYSADSCRSACRLAFDPDHRTDICGFRLALTLP